MKSVDRASKDVQAGLVVLTLEQHTWVLSEPDENELRGVYFDGKEEGQGILLGSVSPMGIGYMTRSPDVEVDRQLGIEFPDRPKESCVLISALVTAIIVMAQKEGAAANS